MAGTRRRVAVPVLVATAAACGAVLALAACGGGPGQETETVGAARAPSPAATSAVGSPAAEKAAVEKPGDVSRYADRSAAAYRAGLVGYLWGAPLVTMSRTRDRLRCVAPANKMINVTQLATPASRSVVGPNNDTLYSTAWLDLRGGPVVLGVPAIPDRYYGFQFLDMYTNTIANIGTRTTGTTAGRFAVVGPGWRGRLPAGVTRIDAPTPEVWMLGRTLVDGPSDLPNVTAIQRQYTITTLGGASPSAGPADSPAPDCAHPADPQDLVSQGTRFYDELGRDMKRNPPPPADRAVVAQLAHVGIRPGTTPSSTTDEAVADGLAHGLAAANQLITARAAGGDTKDSWTVNLDMGTYGVRYLTRAIVARTGLAANVAAEAVYYRGARDATGKPLDGRTDYVIHFPAGQLPPVGTSGFWSLTVYDTDHFLVANPINRYSLGDRTPGLTRNPDGSLDVYVGAKQPAAGPANWLPAPAASFYLTLRIYVPTAAVLDRTWRPPAITARG